MKQSYNTQVYDFTKKKEIGKPLKRLVLTKFYSILHSYQKCYKLIKYLFSQENKFQHLWIINNLKPEMIVPCLTDPYSANFNVRQNPVIYNSSLYIGVTSVPIMLFWIRFTFRLRSEQAPGSVFHPRDKSDKKNDCDFLRPFWCNTIVDPER